MRNILLLLIAITVMLFAARFAGAEQPVNPAMKTLLDAYAAEAGVQGFNAEDGRKLFFSSRTHSEKGEERGCTTCHTKDPSQKGKTHVGKVIDPISPAVNSERFTDPKHVEKWFRRNCKWVLERQCTAKEKGDFITFMMSL